MKRVSPILVKDRLYSIMKMVFPSEKEQTCLLPVIKESGFLTTCSDVTQASSHCPVRLRAKGSSGDHGDVLDTAVAVNKKVLYL